MAAVAPPPPPTQPGAYSAQAPAQAPQYQTQASRVVPINDPLFEALKQYVTSGPDAEHITAGQLQEVFQTATTGEGARAGLETFLSSVQSFSSATIPLWEKETTLKGRFELTKVLFKFDFEGKDPILGVEGLAFHVQSPRVIDVE